MARVKHSGGEAGVREFLLAELVELRDIYLDKLSEVEQALSVPLNALICAEPYSFSRYQLPDGHPMRLAGGMGDILVLTEDDVLVDGGGSRT